MQPFDCILFDLDGTLTDSARGIVNSVLYALKKHGIGEKDREKLLAFVGPPLSESFMKYYGVSNAQAEVLIEAYREYFRESGWKENAVYPGIPEMLETLRTRGMKLYVATSKPEVFAKQILSYFRLDHLFEEITGSTLDGRISRKGQVIACVKERIFRDNSTHRLLMVGDRSHDVAGAKENGIPCIGVLYGYGSEKELADAGAAAVCPAVEQLPEMIERLSFR